MTPSFRTIGLIGKPNHQGANHTLVSLYHFLKKYPVEILVEERVAASLGVEGVQAVDLVDLGKIATWLLSSVVMVTCSVPPEFWLGLVSLCLA